MNGEKYIGLDVHQATIVVAVMDSSGKLVMESILETKAATILQFFAGLRGTLSVTFEEGTWSAWLYDLLNSHVDKLVVCNPRKNALLKDGNKSDRIDARKLADLLRGNQLKPVYHGETGVRMLRELSRSYLTIVKDLARVMNRLKAVYRSWAIPCAGRDVYYTRHRAQWLAKIREAGVRCRAQRLYEQLDMLQHLRQQARRELLAESRKHAITAKLRQIPYLGPIRSALAVALIQTPHRFRTKRQLWAYSGLALETRISAEYRYVDGQVRRSKKLLSIRGLNKDHNHDLKGLFKGAANISCLYPVYVRGGAYLAAGQGGAAAAEFQKILDHSGIVWNCWTGALARLGVARANALQSRTSQGADADAARVRALAAYKDFLTLWKDADPDIPILKEAKAEYAKLQ